MSAPFEFPYNNGTGRIVGRVNAWPQHPNPGTLVLPFPNAHHGTETGQDATLFALVSVDWATRIDTVDLDTGTTTTSYVPGALGMPSGITWNLRPVDTDTDGQLVLATGRWAAGHHVVTLPDAVRAEAPTAPTQVRIHDHRI